jgi:hypothetical protein
MPQQKIIGREAARFAFQERLLVLPKTAFRALNFQFAFIKVVPEFDYEFVEAARFAFQEIHAVLHDIIQCE